MDGSKWKIRLSMDDSMGVPPSIGNLQFDHHQKSWGVSNLNPKHPQTLRFHPKFQLSGRVAEIFFTALRDAASRGLDVVLLVDYIGAFALRQAGKRFVFYG